ncbi:MAG TPA: hypothetical protein VJ804_04200, partial [Acidimicrobiales bacterium]|nr:hypothetical protein [Acidimicrobiales bacterium]
MLRSARGVSCTLVAGLLIAVGCADDPREPESADLRRVIVRSLEEADQDNALHFTDEEAACTADRVMRAISDDRLKDLGVDEGFGLSTLDFSPEEEGVVFAALDACVDLVGQVAATIGRDTGLADDPARCVAAAYVSSAVFRDALFAGEFDPALEARIDAALGAAAEGCGLPA